MKRLLMSLVFAFLLGAPGQTFAGDVNSYNPNIVNTRPADRPSSLGRNDPSPNSPSVTTSRDNKSTITNKAWGDTPKDNSNNYNSTTAK